jgi:hypothetical protein
MNRIEFLLHWTPDLRRQWPAISQTGERACCTSLRSGLSTSLIRMSKNDENDVNGQVERGRGRGGGRGQPSSEGPASQAGIAWVAGSGLLISLI